MSHIDDLRNEVRRLGRNPAGLQPLVQLGQELMDVYNRLGPRTPAAKPLLGEAVDVLQQAYVISQAADAIRGLMASVLGPAPAARYGVPDANVQDRENGIRMMEEALSSPGAVEPRRATTQLALGRLYMGRVLTYTQSDGFSVVTSSTDTKPSERALEDTGRAIDCFRGVLASRPVNADLADAAGMLLGVAEAIRTTLDAVVGLDIRRLTRILANLPNLRDKIGAGGAAALDLPAHMPSPSVDHPAAVIEAPRPMAAPAALPDVVELRHSLYALLPYGSPQGWPAAVALLQPDLSPLDTGLVDDIVTLAQRIVDQPESDEALSGLDHYFLAVALLLRDRRDEASPSEDRARSLTQLLAAVRKIPLVHPSALPVLRSLGAFVSQARPLDRALARVAGGLADRLDGAILAGLAQGANLAVLDALRCLCRAAEALEYLRQAATRVPEDYPWPSMAAARQLAEAINQA